MRRIPGGCATDDGAPVMRASIAAFYQALRAGTAPRASLDEGLAVVRTCLRTIGAANANLPTEEEEPCHLSATASS